MYEKDWSWEELVYNTWESEPINKEDEELIFGSPEAEAFEREFWGLD